MTIRFYESAFHALFPRDIAHKLVLKADAMIAIKIMIDKQGWTQAEAAKKLGVTEKIILNLINGKINEIQDDLPEKIMKLKMRSTS